MRLVVSHINGSIFYYYCRFWNISQMNRVIPTLMTPIMNRSFHLFIVFQSLALLYLYACANSSRLKLNAIWVFYVIFFNVILSLSASLSLFLLKRYCEAKRTDISSFCFFLTLILTCRSFLNRYPYFAFKRWGADILILIPEDFRPFCLLVM